ncbi:MAG: creatininase family protein [Pseudothermotoga sp.]
MTEYLILSAEDIGKYHPDKTLIVSVLSPIETHGKHLPVGTDVFIARKILQETCQILSERFKILRLPDLCVGADSQPVFGSISLKYKTLKNIVIETGESLAKMGFKYWMIFDNHGGPRHQLALFDAIVYLKKKYQFVLVVPFLHIFQEMLKDSPQIGIPAGMNGDVNDLHAGTNETSLMLQIHPEMVRSYNLPRYFPSIRSRLGDFLRFLRTPDLAVTVGWVSDPKNPYYLGDPSMADPERGKRMIDYHVKRSVELFQKALNGDYQLPKLHNAIVRFLLRTI